MIRRQWLLLASICAAGLQITADAQAAPGQTADSGKTHITLVDPNNVDAQRVAKWFVAEQNLELAKYSSSTIVLNELLHVMSEKDKVEIQEEAGGYMYDMTDKGKTYAIVVLTEQRCNSKLYQQIEVPLWEVRNATVYQSASMKNYLSIVKQHVPERLPVALGLAKPLAQLAVDELNSKASYKRFGLHKVFDAEKQQMDIDFEDLFYEKDSAGQKLITITYVFFSTIDLENMDNLNDGKPDTAKESPRQHYLAAIYTGPDKKHRVVELMDIEERHDVGEVLYSEAGLPAEAKASRNTVYNKFRRNGSWVFLFLGTFSLVVALGFMCIYVCQRQKKAELEGIQLLRTEPRTGKKFTPRAAVEEGMVGVL